MEQESKYVETPVAAIRTAKQFVYFAWFLYEAVLRGAITAAHFTNEILDGRTIVHWPVENRTQEPSHALDLEYDPRSDGDQRGSC